MKYYRLWVLAFLLKFIGSAWDASYHFKYLFEEYSIPHIVNTIGFALGAYLLIQEWRRLNYLDRFSRNLITIGYVIFLIGIPLDFTYHIAYGIDLTTWSPTHFIYYIGTAIMIFGVWHGYFLYTRDIQPSWWSLHTWFAMYLLECLMFPNMQQENGAISYDQYIHGKSIASKEILELISDPASQIFGGIPEWVYPTYSILMVALLTILIIRYCRDYTIPVMATALYILLRFVGKAIFAAVGYPTSYVPITLLFIPLCYLLFRKTPRLAGLAGSLAYFLTLYAIHITGILITPPLVLWELAPVVVIGVLVPMIHSMVKLFQIRKTEKKVV
ncbi:hypothetical protein J7E79_01300 [Bacillus sp. ISL-40]|uniref:hypothetical protein n=1 Tax=unclassified Bacillus (in: firmicutes) TaxID=185979 RepID=UPI001BED3670|nr:MULTISPECIES: hypothetical protein [unclassified Bacillus (in: firmicutes)]MBT2696080.1 hypothetical protein [Bacillus sp. ISL-40]MBT2723266.1 hypothetical protein [Bacillus sp. ISL-46]MBT2744368.1 hypothetical protein [Bacillus sp. ISL-77]